VGKVATEVSSYTVIVAPVVETSTFIELLLESLEREERSEVCWGCGLGAREPLGVRLGVTDGLVPSRRGVVALPPAGLGAREPPGVRFGEVVGVAPSRRCVVVALPPPEFGVRVSPPSPLKRRVSLRLEGAIGIAPSRRSVAALPPPLPPAGRGLFCGWRMVVLDPAAAASAGGPRASGLGDVDLPGGRREDYFTQGGDGTIM
jgi:hypothetical protein